MDTQRAEHLIETYGDMLFRTALTHLKNPAEAEDAVQDTFLKVLEKQPSFESAAHEKAWLLRVIINLCHSRWRTPWWRRTVPLSDALPATPQEREELDAILALPPKERLTIHLFYYEGYHTDEIAAITGEKPGTVRSRLTRARTRLRAILKGELEL